jgi:hypothetical protein
MGAMFVNEDVYWSMERLFSKLIDKYFNIDDWFNSEIHATDIWHGNSLSRKLSIAERRGFFDEFLQVCGKFALPYVFSFGLKNHSQKVSERNLDMLQTAWCLLSGIERNLANIHQTGILVCDAYDTTNELSLRNIKNLNVEKETISPAQALLRQFYEMTSWRSIDKTPSFTLRPKYPMESMSAYLVDRVHFLRSDDSLFLQMCDIMTFIVQRCLVHDYLLVVQKVRIDPDKVPITSHGLSMMRSQMFPFCYDKQVNDIAVCHSLVPDDGDSLVLKLSAFLDIFDLHTHYEQMQHAK